MIKRRDSIAWRLIILLLMIGLAPRPAYANNRSLEEGLTGRANIDALAGPIGIIKSLGIVMINGRAAYDGQLIWSGDVIQAPAGTSLRVLIDSVGQITVNTGVTMKLSTKLSKKGDGINRYVLVASLISGDINVKLRPQASAYIETHSSVITAASAASFRLDAGDEEARVDVFGGEVNVEPQSHTRKIRLNPVVPAPGTGATKPGSGAIYVDVGQPRQLNLKATEKKSKAVTVSSSFFPVADEPVKDLRIRFTLDPPSIGQFKPEEALTDEFGVVSTTFIAGNQKGKGKFIATVVDFPNNKYVGKIVVGGKPPGKFRLRNLLIGAAVIGAIVVVIYHPSKRPIEHKPPVEIEP